MTLKKIQLKAGVNKENTRYTNENGWYSCDKIRFRQGTPEKIGGWTRSSTGPYLGVCRALFAWSTLTGDKNIGVGTNLKYYIQYSSTLYDITPLRTFTSTGTLTNPFATTISTSTITVTDTAHGCQTGDIVYYTGATAVDSIPAAELNTRHVITVLNANTYTFTVTSVATSSTTGGGTVAVTRVKYAQELGSNPFATVSGSPTVTVTATAHGALTGDFVTFSGATTVAGLDLNNQYQVTVITANSYTITASSNASATTTGGGSAVLAAYQINVGPDINYPANGWGAGPWGTGTWGFGGATQFQARIWNQSNFGEDLIYGPRYAGLYYWSASDGVTARGVALNTMPGASDVPTAQLSVVVSDSSRFVIAFGCNDYGSNNINPMLIRWSAQEDPTNWTPAATNQAGSLLLSYGSEISTVLQTRQELLVLTDSAIYSMQYQGAPVGWGVTLLASNISSISPNGIAYASNVAYWMGVDKFYFYDGTVQTLNCDLRKYVFNDINVDQPFQVYAGTNEPFNEVWWFYCSKNSTTVDRYVVYNYLEKVWYYGNMDRTAWLNSGLFANPLAASYSQYTLLQESGVDDGTTEPAKPLAAYIESAEFDIDDGDHFAFVYRILPDITFEGSTSSSPSAQISLLSMQNSGSGYNSVALANGTDSAGIVRTSTAPIEQFTGQVYIRARGRQFILRLDSTDLGVAWQMGSPRLDFKPDGRR